MRVLEDKILVERNDALKITPSGIVLPESARKCTSATVIAAGPDSGVSVGHTVLLQSNIGYPVKVEGNEYYVITSKQVLVVL